jgi:hypothetical protein
MIKFGLFVYDMRYDGLHSSSPTKQIRLLPHNSLSCVEVRNTLGVLDGTDLLNHLVVFQEMVRR